MATKNINVLEFPNALGSGINVKLVHHPMFDGPLKNYKNRKDCKVITMNLDEDKKD
jgi:hypothetical protein